MSDPIVQSGSAETNVGGGAPTVTPDSSVTPEVKPQTPASGAQKPVVSEDQRLAGVIADLTRERKSRQTLENELKRLRDEGTQRDQRFRQVFGGEKSPQEQEADAVKAAIAQMFPALAKLTPEALEKVMGVVEHTDSLRQSANAVWDMRASSARSFLFEKVANAIGADKLSERQQDRLTQGLINYLDSNDELRLKYEAGDNGPIEGYIAEFLEDWFEPARRRGIQSEVEKARRVPSGRDRSIPGKDKKPIDFSKEKDVSDALVDAFRAQGGKFGR